MGGGRRLRPTDGGADDRQEGAAELEAAREVVADLFAGPMGEDAVAFSAGGGARNVG